MATPFNTLSHAFSWRHCLLAIAGVVTSAGAASLPHRVITSAGDEEDMIIALPGAGETAKAYCDVFSEGKYRRLAQQRGYVLVCLSSYGLPVRAENYERRLVALRDELVTRHPRVKRVFLTGYSVGGRGALLVGLRHPDKFDGVASIVPWMRFPNDRRVIFPEIVSRLKTYPHRVFVAWAALDLFYPLGIKDQDILADAAEGSLRRRRYWTDHWFVIAASAKDMFDFFDRQRTLKSVR